MTATLCLSDPEAEWVGTSEACQLLGVTLRSLYRLIDEGKLPAYRLGRVIRLRRQDIAAFLESTRIVPGDVSDLYPEPKGRDDT